MSGKYDRYFFSGLPKDDLMAPKKVIAALDGENFPGCHQYFIRWIEPVPYGMEPATDWTQVGHGPHMHKSPEVVVHIGTNPNDPYDLGGEAVMYMGPEMEKHLITKSTLIYLPANMIHGPWIIKKVNRPWIFMTISQESDHTEKSFPEMTPKEEVDNVYYYDQGYDSNELVIREPNVIKRMKTNS